MKKIVTIVLLGLLVASLFSACNHNEQTASESMQEVSAAPVPTHEIMPNHDSTQDTQEAAGATYEIQTRYALLKYPARWKDIVKTDINESDPYTVRFSAYDVKLFELYFNTEQGDILGTLITEDGQFLLSTQMETIDKDFEHYEQCAMMQEDVNVLTAQLAEDYQFIPGVDAREETVDVYEIKTPIATLSYPVKWKDKVSVEVVDNGAKFSCSGTPLFDVLFGAEEGIAVGQYDGKTVRIVDYAVEDDEMANMQEDVNVILTYLQKDGKFSSEG